MLSALTKRIMFTLRQTTFHGPNPSCGVMKPPNFNKYPSGGEFTDTTTPRVSG